MRMFNIQNQNQNQKPYSRWLTQLTLDRGTDEAAYQATGLYDGLLAEQVVLWQGDREVFIEWKPCGCHNDQVFPEITVRGPDWSVFADWRGFFDSLGAMDKAALSPDRVLEIAQQQGFVNLSIRTKEQAPA